MSKVNRTSQRTTRLDSLSFTLLAVVAGALAAYGALGFLFLIGAVQTVFFGFEHGKVYSTVPTLPWWRIVLAPALGGLLVGLIVWRWMPGRRTYGPADAMRALHEENGRMPIGVGLGSAAVSALSIGAGASVGRYGPAVHLGASVSSWLAQVLELDRGQRMALLGCGAASAIAASFNAPLGGVLFASEVLLGGRALRAFIPIVTASVVGTAIARLHLGDFSIFTLSDYAIEHVYEYPSFALIGVLGGLLAIAFMRGMDLAIRGVERTGLPVWARPMIGGLLLGLIAIRLPHVLGLGDEAIHDALGQLFPVGLLLLLMVAKLVATSLSVGFGFSGGVFGPALFLGAMLGSAVGNVLFALFPEWVSSPSIYAVAGMGSVISCVIGAPIATILIAFELTSSYALTTAVMLAVVFAGMTTRRLYPQSYFNLQLMRQGVDIEVAREVEIMRSRTVREVASNDYSTVSPDTPISVAEEVQLRDQPNDILVVDGEGRLRGLVTLFQIVEARRRGESGAPIGAIANLPALVLEQDTDLHEAIQSLRGFIGISVPVVRDRESRQLVGVVYESAIIDAYNVAVEEARREEDALR